MKWWGWGVEGVGLPPRGQAGFRALRDRGRRPGRRHAAAGSMSLDALTIPEPKSRRAARRAERRGRRGERLTEDLDRIVHTYGKSVRDLLRLRTGDIPRVPDVVVYPGRRGRGPARRRPGSSGQRGADPVRRGSNIAGSLQAPADETRPVISVDLGRLNRCSRSTTSPGWPGSRPGRSGPDIEDQLRPLGWTLGHFPDSFTHSTLGGWVATRSSGMQSDKYGDIADITRGLRVVMPGKMLVLRPLPSTSTGPSVREMILGSEGRLGDHHRGHGPGAPHPGEAADPGLPVPDLGRRPGRHAGDLHQ